MWKVEACWRTLGEGYLMPCAVPDVTVCLCHGQEKAQLRMYTGIFHRQMRTGISFQTTLKLPALWPPAEIPGTGGLFRDEHWRSVLADAAGHASLLMVSCLPSCLIQPLHCLIAYIKIIFRCDFQSSNSYQQQRAWTAAHVQASRHAL